MHDILVSVSLVVLGFYTGLMFATWAERKFRG